jgi:hypothetical protein
MTMRVYREQEESPRLAQARRQMTELTNELNALYARFYQFSFGERAGVVERIVSIRAALADATDEYRRARCGAPVRERVCELDQMRKTTARKRSKL